MTERLLVVAPSWVGDAILSEPLVALLRDPYEDPIVDVLVHSWCAPVYARMRGVGQVFENPIGHGRLDWPRRKALARAIRERRPTRASTPCVTARPGATRASTERSPLALRITPSASYSRPPFPPLPINAHGRAKPA